MLEHIRQYYIDEKGLSIPAFAAAATVLALAAFLLVKHAAHPLARGMGTGLVVAGVLLTVAGFSARNFNEKKLKELTARVAVPELELQQSEVARMDKVMNVTFRYAFIAFVVLMLAAMLWIMLTKSAYWRGMGVALMILVALATIGDSFNAYRNARYLDTVRAYTPGER